MRSLRLRAYIAKYAHYIPRLQVHFLPTGVDKMFANFYIEKRGEYMTKVELEKLVSTLSERLEKVEKEIEVLKAPKVSDPPKPPARSLVFR
jgi:hypothetical protein